MPSSTITHFLRALTVSAALLLFGAEVSAANSARLRGHVPAEMIARARHLGRKPSHDRLSLAVSLKPRDPQGLAELVTGLYDPADPRFRQFLSPAQFRERFSPLPDELGRAIGYFTARGLSLTKVHESNLLINFEGSTADVEGAFDLEMHEYVDNDGRRIHAPSNDPAVSYEMEGKLTAITGLSNFSRLRTHQSSKVALNPAATPHALTDYMTPAKIKSAYGLAGVAATGAGESLALFELDGYAVADITNYVNQFTLAAPSLTKVAVDGGSGALGTGQDEVTLDIELAVALAPGLSHIYVYEGPNTDQGVLDTYAKIANDNLAKTVSSSWGSPETLCTAAFKNAENVIFTQMAAQGQSIFAASGDAGAYDNTAAPAALVVDDPASQPYVTSVGGTTLTLSGVNYSSESSWGSSPSGGGGGISAYWALPTWQSGLASTSNKGSAVFRMVPDVSLDANPATGYPIYSRGAWYAIGGTSAAAPLWAAFTALVNQTRVAGSLARLGFANPSLYQLGQSTLKGSVLHDIQDGSTNLHYPAVAGYDLSTGLGTFQGAAMLAALSSALLPPYPPATLTLTAGGNAINVSWGVASGAVTYDVWRSTSSTGVYSNVAPGLAGTTFSDPLANGTYYYYVTATNGAGTSGPSIIRFGTPSVAAPAAPTGLSALVIP